MRRRRDQDYRGTKTTVDWTKLVHQTRMGKPGALEVLQDAVEMYFPEQFIRSAQAARQFADAQKQSDKEWREDHPGYKFPHREWLVGFNSKTARARFYPGKNARSTLVTPFNEYSLHSVKQYGKIPHVAFLWSSRTGKKIDTKLMKRMGGILTYDQFGPQVTRHKYKRRR